MYCAAFTAFIGGGGSSAGKRTFGFGDDAWNDRGRDPARIAKRALRRHRARPRPTSDQQNAKSQKMDQEEQRVRPVLRMNEALFNAERKSYTHLLGLAQHSGTASVPSVSTFPVDFFGRISRHISWASRALADRSKIWRTRQVSRRGRVLEAGSESARVAITSDQDQYRIAVVGATGGVAFHIIKQLLEKDNKAESKRSVVAVVRDEDKARVNLQSGIQKLIGERALSFLEIRVADTREGGLPLRAALADADVVVLCTGTTAFPTKAWKGGNGPAGVDETGARNVVNAALQAQGVKRIVALSSIGVTRRNRLPFSILNLFGALDAKVELERIVSESGIEYTILRLGRLVGAPFSNIGALKKDAPKRESRAVQISREDTLSADVAREDAALVAVEAITSPSTANRTFSVVNASIESAANDSACIAPWPAVRSSSNSTGTEQWEELFGILDRPNEVLRLEFTQLNAPKLQRWLSQWAGAVLSSGALYPPLPMPVRVDHTENGVMMTFLSVDDGKVVPRGALNVCVQPREKASSRKSKDALVVFREPLFRDSPFPGEAQILDQLKEDLVAVTTSYAPEA